MSLLNYLYPAKPTLTGKRANHFIDGRPPHKTDRADEGDMSQQNIRTVLDAIRRDYTTLREIERATNLSSHYVRQATVALRDMGVILERIEGTGGKIRFEVFHA